MGGPFKIEQEQLLFSKVSKKYHGTQDNVAALI